VLSDGYISNVQCHADLTYHFQFGTLALGLSARVPECQKMKMVG